MQEEEFQIMFSTYSDMIYRLALSYCDSTYMAEDIVQEVFLRCLKSSPVFENEAHKKNWFIRVAINCCKNQLTSAWRRHTLPLEEAMVNSPPVFEDPRQEQLYEKVSALPQKYRLVLYLYYYEDYSTKEIASLLHTTKNNVSARLSRARKKLKDQFDTDLALPRMEEYHG